MLDALSSLSAQLPLIGAAILIVVAAWLLARLARKGARRLADGFNRLLERFFRQGPAAGARLSRPFIAVFGELAFWLVLLVGIFIATSVAGWQSVSGWLGRIALHIPHLFAGAAIVIAGYFISMFLREAITTGAGRGDVQSAGLLGRVAQGMVLALALIIALDQVGIEVTVLIVAFAILCGGLVAGLMAAFALGARAHVANLVGARHARSELRPGVRVRIGDQEGPVLEVTATHIVIDSQRGRLLVPAAETDKREILVVTTGPGEEDRDG